MRINKTIMKIVFSTLIIIAILGNMFTVKAATATMNFTVTPSKVKPGENFAIILKAQSPENLNGVMGEFEFDAEKVEFVKKSIVNTDVWNNGAESGSNELFAYVNEGGISSADVYKIEFKVKDTVSVGEKVSVVFKNLQINTMDVEEYINIDDQTITLDVVDTTPSPTPTTEPTVTPTPTTDPTATPTEDVTPTNTDENTSGKEVVVYTDDDDNTTKTSKNAISNNSKSGASTLPYTGFSSFIVLGIVLVGIASVGLYFANRKYRGI